MTQASVKQKFRKDINALRAWAVLGVVFFHFLPLWCPGGFAGVDVFFVISGYLMTGIVFRGIEKGDLSLTKFYMARANRIIPTLACFCLTLLILGFFLLTPSDYSSLGKHVASSISFLSNIVYWQESGYFDASSHEKWLLHTWSLSVEWQFYIIYPLVMLLLSKLMNIKTLKRSLLIFTIFGFIISTLLTQTYPSASYFLLITRFWEMTIGGVALLYPINLSHKQKIFTEYLGATLITISYFIFSAENPWPGHLALVPVLGAYLIIQANRDNSFLSDNIFLQKIGAWSYSIYLWHWPLVVAMYYFSLSSHFIALGILSSIILGFLSYKYIESYRFSNKYGSTLEILRSKTFLMSLALIILGVFVYLKEPNNILYKIPKSFSESIVRKSYDCFDKIGQHKTSLEPCQLSDGDRGIFAFGDSHLYAALPSLEQKMKDSNISLHYSGFSGCPPFLDVYPVRKDQDKKNCKELNDRVYNYIKAKNIKTLFLAARWNFYTDGWYSGTKFQALSLDESQSYSSREDSKKAFETGLNRTLKAYNDLGVRLILMLQVPLQEYRPEKLYVRSILKEGFDYKALLTQSVKKEKHYKFQFDINKTIRDTVKKYPNVIVLDPTDIFCDESHCPVGSESISYYFDYDHLSVEGSKRLLPLFDGL